METLNTSYRDYHEKFMSNHTGSSSLEVLFVVTQFPVLIYIVSYVNSVYFTFHNEKTILAAYITEFMFLVMPMILCCTLLNYYALYVLSLLCIVVITTFVHHLSKCTKKHMNLVLNVVIPVKNRAYLTYFRAVINLMSAFCILAVDFKIFPRKFAKTESFGFSLMDTGVGFYVLSNGLVVKPLHTKTSFLRNLLNSAPLLLLGVVRSLSVRNLDYQQHISEYGEFWNFFFTLAFVKMFSSLIISFGSNRIYILPFVVAILHQLMLSSGLQNWILSNASRDNFFTANREGIISLPGYVSLYLASVCIGHYLNNNIVDLRKDIKYCFKLLLCSLTFFLITLYLHKKLNISRQTVNLTYISWMLTLCFFLLGMTLIIEICLRVIFLITCVKNSVTPYILESINYNGLLFFLSANLLTGFINLKVETLNVDPLNSLALLTVYMLTLCISISFLYLYKIKIKFW